METIQNDHEELSKYRILRSKETLEDAILLIDNDRYISAVNRLYYACFYAVLAYLHKIHIVARTHEGIKKMFGKHLVLTGLVDTEMASFYARLLNKRITGDYDEFQKITKEDILDLKENAIRFITRIENLL